LNRGLAGCVSDNVTYAVHDRWRRLRTLIAPILVAASFLLVAGCGGGEEAAPPKKQQTTEAPPALPSMPSPFVSVEQMAATVGCEAKSSGNTKDFRQTACLQDGDRFVFLNFDTPEAQAAWLDYALLWGGIYLVGDRWVLQGPTVEDMKKLGRTLGGEIKEGGSKATKTQGR
jgi:hypothetical protein